MKEASGELNMTVITIVAIAAVAAFFYLLIWPSIQQSMALNTACNAAGNGEYTTGDANGNHVACKDGSCTYYDESGIEQGNKTCN